MKKLYNSIEEIDERLAILKIHRKIEVESLKLKVNQTKSKLLPSHLMSNLSGGIQQILLTFAIKKLSTFFRRKKEENYAD